MSFSSGEELHQRRAMLRTIHELFTYSATDRTEAARASRTTFFCPILGSPCSKNNDDGAERNDSVLSGPLGACSVYNPKAVGPSHVTCLCPVRLYGDEYATLRTLAQDLLSEPERDVYMFDEWASAGRPTGIVLVGKGSLGEMRTEAGSLDWVAAYVANGAMVKYGGIEAQAIDTTGNYRANRAALMREDHNIPPSGHGLNWENVNKRIIPQLLRKGMLLKRLAETEPAVGLGFLVDANVYSKFEARIGSSMNDDDGFALVVHAYSLEAKRPYAATKLVLHKSVHASVDQLAERFLAVPDSPDSIALRVGTMLEVKY